MSTYEITLVIFLVCVAVGRILSEKAMRLLSADEKVRLLDALSGLRAFSFIPLIVIVVLVFGMPRWLPDAASWLYLAGLALVLAYALSIHIFISRKLSTL